jgi:trigger factor
LSSTVEQLNPTRVKLTVVIPFADLTPALTKAYRQIASQVTIPGFRKGHVPPAIIDQRVGRMAVLSEAINEVLPDHYGRAVAEHELAVIGQPQVDLTRLEDGEEVEFTAEVDVRPEFDLPDFSDVTVTVPTTEVSDEAVQERVDLLRERFAETHEVDRPAQEGDSVTMSLVGRQNGEDLADATADDVPYVIGSGGMIDGLDEAVTGLSAGESATFETELVGGEHEGEKAEVTVTVSKVDERVLPEVDDDFAQLASSFDTAEEMMADLREGMERGARLNQLTKARDEVLDAGLEKADFPLPEDLVASEIQARKDQVNEQLGRIGMTVERYLDEVGDGEDSSTPEEFWENIEKAALKAIRSQMLLSAMADGYSVQISNEDLTSLILQKAQRSGSTPEQEINHMREHNHLPEWTAEIRHSKALDQAVRQATVVDEAGDPVDLSEFLAPVPAPAEAAPAGDGFVSIPLDTDAPAED